MNHVLLWTASAAIALTMAAPAQAQSAIEVPANASWKHEGSGLILRSHVAGLTRSEIKDSTNAELDVSVGYDSSDGAVHATLYIFRPAVMSVPVWFDRAQTQIELGKIYGGVTASGAPMAFAPPNATTPSALRQVYVTGNPRFKSTGLAALPLGEWLVTVRVSSSSLDPEALNAKMSEIIAGIRWPEAQGDAQAAVVVQPCATQLAFDKRAKLRKPDMSEAIIGSALITMVPETRKETPTAPVLWCRDATPPTQAYGVYRSSEGTNAYTLALGDAGTVIAIQPSAFGKDGYMVWHSDLEGTSTYPSFDRLPEPGAVIPALSKSSPMSRAKRGGKEITIGLPEK